MRQVTRVTVVSIGGSDSGGGAGIQGDLLTLAAHGVHAATVVVAGTAQNTRGVTAVEPFSPGFVGAQIDAVFSDLEPAAVKVGLLFGPGQVRAVAAGLRRHGARNVVLDPVLASSGGVSLLSPEGVRALKRDLLPLCGLVTPNLPEAAALAGAPVGTPQGVRRCAREIARLGPRAVLIKGGHAAGDRVRDVLWTGRRFRTFENRRLAGDAHGTGCALASAIAANRALGRGLEESVERAIRYVRQALRRGFFPGGGARVLGHPRPGQGQKL
jgi:hydroxymethylpyrimidine/phosphomethylpyrimidine kinase